VNIVSVGVVDRVRAITDAYRSRWQAKATPEAIMPLLGMVRQIVIAESDEEARALAAPAYERWFNTFTHLSRQRDLIRIRLGHHPILPKNKGARLAHPQAIGNPPIRRRRNVVEL
jgi:hypothetical protein